MYFLRREERSTERSSHAPARPGLARGRLWRAPSLLSEAAHVTSRVPGPTSRRAANSEHRRQSQSGHEAGRGGEALMAQPALACVGCCTAWYDPRGTPSSQSWAWVESRALCALVFVSSGLGVPKLRKETVLTFAFLRSCVHILTPV